MPEMACSCFKWSGHLLLSQPETQSRLPTISSPETKSSKIPQRHTVPYPKFRQTIILLKLHKGRA